MTVRDLKKDNGDSINVESADLENMFQVFKDRRGNYVYNINSTVYFPDLKTLPDSVLGYYQCKELDHWTTVSYNIYGTTRYAWLIMKLNNVRNALNKPFTGQTLVYISPDKVDQIMNILLG